MYIAIDVYYKIVTCTVHVQEI